MKSLLTLAWLCAALAASPQARTPAQADRAQLPKGAMADLGRPTTGDDPLPPLNVVYGNRWWRKDASGAK